MTKFLSEEAIGPSLKEFNAYLRNRGIAYRSRMMYVRILKQFFSGYPPEIEHYNRFLNAGNTSYARPAMTHFLTMIGHPELSTYLARYRRKAKKLVKRSYLPKEKIQKIIKNIEAPDHKLAAQIQYDCGLRSAGIISLMARNIKENENGDLVFYTIEKGDKGFSFYVSKKTEKAVLKYMHKYRKKYLFMRGKVKEKPDDEFKKWVDNNCRYYRNSLKMAREKVGIENFGTHDFRRNFITEAHKLAIKLFREGKINNEPIEWVRSLIGHKRVETTRLYIKEEAIDRRDAIRELRG